MVFVLTKRTFLHFVSQYSPELIAWTGSLFSFRTSADAAVSNIQGPTAWLPTSSATRPSLLLANKEATWMPTTTYSRPSRIRSGAPEDPAAALQSWTSVSQIRLRKEQEGSKLRASAPAISLE